MEGLVKSGVPSGIETCLGHVPQGPLVQGLGSVCTMAATQGQLASNGGGGGSAS